MNKIQVQAIFAQFKKPKKKILVVSHERSGTHFLINSIAKNIPIYSHMEISISSSDFIDKDGSQRNLIKSEVNQKLSSYSGIKEKRIFKSHHQGYFFIDNLKKIRNEFEIFYMVRDGRDVMVSQYYYFLKNACLNHRPFPHEKNFSEYLKLDPKLFPHHAPYTFYPVENYPQRWSKHILSWLEVKEAIHIVKYEDLKDQFRETISDIANLLEEEVVDNLTSPELLESRSVAPRKGVVGDWMNVFSEDDLAFFWQQAGEAMAAMNYG